VSQTPIFDSFCLRVDEKKKKRAYIGLQETSTSRGVRLSGCLASEDKQLMGRKSNCKRGRNNLTGEKGGSVSTCGIGHEKQNRVRAGSDLTGDIVARGVAQ